MKRVGWLLLYSMVTLLNAKNIPQKDIQVHIGENVQFGEVNAKMVRFGGYTTPECKLAISNDGRYFYLTKVQSTCTKITNSKGVKIICNADKSVCKTRRELIDLITASSKTNHKAAKIGIVYNLDPNGDGFLTLRSKPNGRQIGKLYPDNKLTILAQKGSWYKVKVLKSGKTGWAYGEWIKIVTEEDGSTDQGTIPSWCNASRLNKTEHTICADDNLSALDMKLVEVYGAVKARRKDVAQRAWLKKRNACGNDAACIKKMYEERIESLEFDAKLAKVQEELDAENERLKKENEKRRYDLYRSFCDQGNAEACNAVGMAYDEGTHQFPLDNYKALTYYKKSCDLGLGVGCFNLGVMYANGEGTSRDRHQALRFLEKGCSKGFSDACSSASNIRDQLKNAFRGIRKNDCYRIKEYGPQRVCLEGTGGDACYGLKDYGLQRVCREGSGGDACYGLKDYGEQRVCREGIKTNACYGFKNYNRQRSCQNFNGSTTFWLIMTHYGYYTY